MPKTRQKKEDLVFQHPVSVSVKRLKIEPATSLKYLDVDKLSRASKTEFEVGSVTVGNRRSAVRAVVRKGMVVALKTELCADCTPARVTPDVRDLLKAVQSRIGDRDSVGRPPIPVVEFLQQDQPI